jgi:hypothetical protein
LLMMPALLAPDIRSADANQQAWRPAAADRERLR